MRILVTGGAGFIGSNLVDALADDPSAEILVVDDLSSGSLENLTQQADKTNVRFVHADIRDAQLMRQLARGVDLVYHLAVQCIRVSFRDPFLVHDVNATGTLNLLTAALEENVSRFVYCSSSEVYGTARRVPMDEEHPLTPTTPYGASKLAGEAYTQSFYLTYGLPTTIVRPFNTYGPREHFEGPYGEVIPKFVVRALNNAPLVIFGDGEQTRDFTQVDDTVRGLIAAGTSPAAVGQVINIARGEEVSIKRIAELVLEAVGNTSSTIEYQPARPGDVRRHFADISRARKLLGFEPRIGIREGIQHYLDWLRRSEFDPRAMLDQEKLRNWE